MLINSREIGIRWLLTVLSVSAVVIAAHANGQELTTRMPHAASSMSHTPREWDRYTIRDGEFSVLLPTMPAMTTYELKDDPLSKDRIRHLIAAYSQGVVYAIYVAERKLSLEDYLESRVSSADTKRDVKVGAFNGKEYSYRDESTSRVAQYFITKRYIYTFAASGSTLGNPDVGIPRFFESIKFESNEMDIAMVDGPGVQSSTDPTAAAGGESAPAVAPKETTRKARVITKPEPTYTEEARKNQVTGTVVIRGVFSSYGQVTNLRFVSGLPFGLSEKAMAAARQIRFIPAIKDGHFVSMYIQLEYNFNLY